MQFAFRHWAVMFIILLLLPGCKSGKETDKSNNKTSLVNNFWFISREDFKKLLLENGGTLDANEYHAYGRYLDKYGNRFDLYSLGDDAYHLSCQLNNIPDIALLFQLRNCIRSLSIEYGSR